MDQIRFPQIASAPSGSAPPPSGTRAAILDGTSLQAVSTWRRDSLRAGHLIVGPAIIDQLDSTTIVLAGQTASVDAFGTLLIEERA
jgi:N-methylhydantoinase A